MKTLIVFILGILILPELFSFYSPDFEQRKFSYHPPVKIQWLKACADKPCESAFSRFTAPYVYSTEVSYDQSNKKIYKENTEQIYPVKIGVSKNSGEKKRFHLLSVDSPANIYLIGSDARGRDLFSRVLHALRLSVLLALLGSGISLLAGLFIGVISGYFGGWIGGLLMRLSEFFMMIPGFYFLLAIRSVLPMEMNSLQVMAIVVLLLGAIGWGGVAKVVRGMTLSLREEEYVLAAKALGRSPLGIIFSHILPGIFPSLVVMFAYSLPGFILSESALSVLGLGIQDPYVTLGSLFSEALSVAHWKLHGWMIAPAIVLIALSFYLNRSADVINKRASE